MALYITARSLGTSNPKPYIQPTHNTKQELISPQFTDWLLYHTVAGISGQSPQLVLDFKFCRNREFHTIFIIFQPTQWLSDSITTWVLTNNSGQNIHSHCFSNLHIQLWWPWSACYVWCRQHLASGQHWYCDYELGLWVE